MLLRDIVENLLVRRISEYRVNLAFTKGRGRGKGGRGRGEGGKGEVGREMEERDEW